METNNNERDLIISKKKNNIFKEILRKINVYIAYFKMKFLNEIQYKIAALAGVITQFAWGGMYIMLYTAFLKDGTATDYTIQQMSTYIWLQQAFFTIFNMWSLDDDILEECRTGNISMELVRPINLYSIWHAKTLGRKLAMVSLRAVPIIILCSMPFMGQYGLMAPASTEAFLGFVITLLLSTALMIAYIMIMYACAMKAMISQGLKTTFDLIMQFGSGGVIPLPFMPDAVVNMLKFTPFYYMQNASFNIYNGYITGTKEIIFIILIQIIWLIVFYLIGKKMIDNQLAKVVVQGG